MGARITGLLAWCILSMLISPPFAETAEQEMVPVRIKDVVLLNEGPAVMLVDMEEKRYFIVFIDFFMANAIKMGMNGTVLRRPLTHDLIGNLLARLGARVRKIGITAIQDNTYFALIFMEVNDQVEKVDARPSDALAIAVRLKAPIYAAASLLQWIPAGSSPPEGPPEKTIPLENGAPI